MQTHPSTTTKWSLDLEHSELVFKVKHLMISTVTGRFRNFSVEAETDDHGLSNISGIQVEVDVSSVDTNNEQRDNHLRSADFLDAEKFSEIKFVSQRTAFDSEGLSQLSGNLTIRNITRPTILTVEKGGITTDPYGNTKAGFSLTGKISRKEFGLVWNAITEAGGAVVGDEVKISADIQLTRQD